MINEARILLDEGRYADVLALLRKQIAAESDDGQRVEALYLAASAHIGLGEAAAAADLLAEALRHAAGPLRYSCLMAAANAASRLGDLDAAETHLRQAVAERPASPIAATELAQLLIRARRPVAAEKAARQALERAPRHGPARLPLAIALFLQRRFDETIKSLASADLRQNPQALWLVVRATEASGNSQRALTILAAASRRMRLDYRMALRLASLALKTGRQVVAEGALRQAISERPAAAFPRLKLSALMLSTNRAHEAITLAQQVLGQNPGEPTAGVLLGLALAAAGRLEPAAEQFAALEATGMPLPDQVVLAHARTLIDLQRHEEAEDLLRRELGRRDGWHAGLVALGMLLVDMGRGEEALGLLETAQDLAPDDPQGLYHLARARFSLGDHDGARSDVVRAVELAPRLRPAKVLLARLERGDLVQPATMAQQDLMAFAALAIQKSKAFHFVGNPVQEQPPQSLWAILHDRLTAVSALIRRDFRISFTTRVAGLSNQLLTSVAGFMVFFVLFTVIRHRSPGEMPMGMFILTGFGSLSLFFATSDGITGALNKAQMMLFPKVRPIDLQISRILQNLTLSVAALLLFAAGLFPFDQLRPTHDSLTWLMCLLLLAFVGIGWGMTVEAVRMIFPLIRLINRIINRVLLITSGVFLSYDTLPYKLQQIVAWNPLLHCIELGRKTIIPSMHTPNLTLTYPATMGAVLLFTGLILNLYLRRRMLEGNAREVEEGDDPFT